MIGYIQEIVLYMVGAYVIGSVYGWFLRGIRSEYEARSLKEHYQQLLDQRSAENDSLQQRITQLERNVEQLQEVPPSGVDEHWESEYELNVIPDIEARTLKRLDEANIKTTRDLYKYCDSEDKLFELAEKARVEDFAIARWVSISHLLRVADIDVASAELLEATEIYSLDDLARQKPARLLEKLAKTNQQSEYVEVLPSEQALRAWIEHAGHLLTINSD